MEHFEDRDVTLKLIVLYKFIKSFVQVSGASLLIYENHRGRVLELTDDLAGWVGDLHFMHDAAVAVGQWMMSEITPTRISFGIGLLAVDGCMTFCEGMGLHYRQRWAAWLVVVATSAFIPLELWWLVSRATVVRGVVLVLNVCIVIYLILRVLAAERSSQRPPPGPPLPSSPTPDPAGSSAPPRAAPF